MKVPVNQKLMLTIAEAAEYFSLSVKWLREYARTHPEAAFANGHKWLIFRAQLEEYLAVHARGEGEEQVQIWG